MKHGKMLASYLIIPTFNISFVHKMPKNNSKNLREDLTCENYATVSNKSFLSLLENKP